MCACVRVCAKRGEAEPGVFLEADFFGDRQWQYDEHGGDGNGEPAVREPMRAHRCLGLVGNCSNHYPQKGKKWTFQPSSPNNGTQFHFLTHHRSLATISWGDFSAILNYVTQQACQLLDSSPTFQPSLHKALESDMKHFKRSLFWPYSYDSCGVDHYHYLKVQNWWWW